MNIFEAIAIVREDLKGSGEEYRSDLEALIEVRNSVGLDTLAREYGNDPSEYSKEIQAYFVVCSFELIK